jgi:hypothetical protein
MTGQNHEQPQTEDNILIQVYDAAEAPTHAATASATAKREYQTHNVTRDIYHVSVVSQLNGTNTDLTADKLALGDSTADVSALGTRQALGNETFRTSITDGFRDGQTFTASTFLDSSEGNGQTFREAALVAESSSGTDTPINRFLVNDPGGLLDPKSSNETVTIDIEIRQEDA